jgi:flagellar protein FlgJ
VGPLIFDGRLNIGEGVIDKTQRGELAGDKDLKSTAADFESIFIYYMLQTLRKTVPKDGLFSQKTSSMDTYNMIFDQKLAEDMASKGEGIGLQKMLLYQLDKSHYSNDR